MNYNEFLNFCWLKYLERTPSAKKIFDGLLKRGEVIQNDHIALRTFQYPGMSKEELGQYFIDQGMKVAGHYDFPAKKLKAFHLESTEAPQRPKVFISELCINELTADSQKIIKNCLLGLKEKKDLVSLIQEGRPWRMSYENYQALKEESEYAAWVCAYGFFPNHFTISVNELKQFPQLADLTEWVESLGIDLNKSGGIIKGSPEQYLEQASTMADKGKVSFDEGEFEVPTCYYEFAKRYQEPSGKIYQGFITGNADKIFESTDN